FVVTPAEQLSVIWQALDEDLEGWPLVDPTGMVLTREASAVAAYAALGYTRNLLRGVYPLATRADGVNLTGAEAGVAAWVPILPVVVTAGAGGAPPATVFVALAAGDLIDVMLWWQVDTVSAAGQYEHNFRTDPLAAVGGVAPVDPDWTNIILGCAAQETQPQTTYGHRMTTTAVANAFGIADGVAADWPNDANVIFWGFYRYV
ncbi:unnamed protein product, partial [marine sediment metagenome]